MFHVFRLRRTSRRLASFKKRGFTLTELIIVTTIIAILAAIVFPNYQTARRQLALQRAASKLAQNIRRAQEMATSVERAGDCFEPDGTTPKFINYEYGFGVDLKLEEDSVNWRDKYILYADCKPSHKYEEGPDQDMELKLVDFDVVEIDSLYDSIAGNVERLAVVFIPPDPSVIFHVTPPSGGEDSGASEVSIILRVKNDPSKTKTVTVNKAGLIIVE